MTAPAQLILPLTDPRHALAYAIAAWEPTQEHDEPGWWDPNGREHTISDVRAREGRL